jgi:hypothetical protein
MTSTVPMRDLAAWLQAEIAHGRDAETVVLAGHYAIFSAGANAVDYLHRDEEHSAPIAEMLAFSKYTWKTACEAVASQRELHARLLVLVDDVTFIRPVIGDTHVREQLSDTLAAHYLSALPELPPFHATALDANGLANGAVFKHGRDRWVFAERELRVAHVRRLKALLKSGHAPRTLTANADQSEINVSLEDHAAHCLVHSGHTNCAGGYLELLATLHARGVRRLIALVPMRCLGPITVGTSLANKLFALDRLTVTNVAVPDVTSDVPAAVMRGQTTRGIGE